ncbi:MAG: hypothetical protein OJF51_000815 [Nitrospira sp.]|nr:MAG: hypothetical protein OJF51_000815 [Nitrospira sp.]
MKPRVGWYVAKTVFQHYHDTARGCFEERIVLLKARGSKEAIKLAEAEARQYAKDVGGCKYLEFVNVNFARSPCMRIDST